MDWDPPTSEEQELILRRYPRTDIGVAPSIGTFGGLARRYTGHGVHACGEGLCE